MSLTTIIGRGHSGTRAMSHTLSQSGVFMGDWLNDSGDLLPGWPIFKAAAVMSRYIVWKGGTEWDFSRLHTMPIPDEFKWFMDEYLRSLLGREEEHLGWKLPESTLIYPWVVRLYPDVQYIYWVRNPQDCILGSHLTDDLHEFGVAYPTPDYFMPRNPIQGDSKEWWARVQRAVSWKYQYDIVQATPKPKWWYQVKFEDFVQHQDATLTPLESKLGIPLTRIPVQSEAVGRYLKVGKYTCFDFLRKPMQELGYVADHE